jgi:Fe-S cluster assembly protein SufD
MGAGRGSRGGGAMSNVSMIPGVVSSAAEKRSAALTTLLELGALVSEAPGWMQSKRDEAAVKVRSFSIPSTRDEEWRFTNLSALTSTQFSRDTSAPFSVSFDRLEPFFISEAKHRLVFINGCYAHGFSQVDDLPKGLFIGSLREAIAEETIAKTLQAHWDQLPGNNEVFTLLNSASFEDMAVIWVGKNQKIEQPIQLFYLEVDSVESIVTSPRCLIVVEANSSLTIAEEYASIGSHSNLCNAVTEIYLGENAQVDHSRIQSQNDAGFHIGKTVVTQARSSRYTCHAISLGAKLSRHNLEVHQAGEQTETTLNGLTMIAGEQVGDLHSTIALTAPHGTTRQIQKNIVGDRAHAVFNGKVFVPKAAQMTDAGQLNRNLLLSPKARVDTKPQLEIVADNVKCTHGATVSQLEDDEVFYLQSRGIDGESAQKLLVFAFAFEVVDQIAIESLRERLVAIVNERAIG